MGLLLVCVILEIINCIVIIKKLKNIFIFYSNMILIIWRNVIDLLSGLINEKNENFWNKISGLNIM